jgi:hypothetical protein
MKRTIQCSNSPSKSSVYIDTTANSDKENEKRQGLLYYKLTTPAKAAVYTFMPLKIQKMKVRHYRGLLYLCKIVTWMQDVEQLKWSNSFHVLRAV